MTLKYNLELDDWMAFQKDYLKKNKSIKRLKLFIVLAFSVLLIGFSLVKGNNVYIGLSIVVSIVLVFLIPTLINAKLLNDVKKELENKNNKNILGQQELELNDDGILFKTQQGYNKMNWKSIVEVSTTKTHYFVYNSSMSAVIIPKNKIDGNLEELDVYFNSKINEI